MIFTDKSTYKKETCIDILQIVCPHALYCVVHSWLCMKEDVRRHGRTDGRTKQNYVRTINKGDRGLNI